jgi:hypothetical protein
MRPSVRFLDTADWKLGLRINLRINFIHGDAGNSVELDRLKDVRSPDGP